MNEWLLVVVVLAIFVVVYLSVRQIKQPYITYVRLLSSVLLMILVWGFAEEGRWPYQLGLTALAIYNVINTIIDYRKQYTNSDTGQKG